MRRALLVMATMMFAVLVIGGVALAANIDCADDTTIKCVGTHENDLITGSTGPDDIFARHGDDTVNGNGAHDEIHGGVGSDTLNGNADGDTFFGDGGADTLTGADGVDNFGGGSGNDTINADFNDTAVPQNSFEVSVGGRGDDHIITDDGQVDHISCGAGTDRVDFDAADANFVLDDCETLVGPG